MMTHTRYRIYTENCSPVLVGRHFAGFTIYRPEGYWQGKRESSTVVEILSPNPSTDYVKVLRLAREIREQYRQAEVWITSDVVDVVKVRIDSDIKQEVA